MNSRELKRARIASAVKVSARVRSEENTELRLNSCGWKLKESPKESEFDSTFKRSLRPCSCCKMLSICARLSGERLSEAGRYEDTATLGNAEDRTRSPV